MNPATATRFTADVDVKVFVAEITVSSPVSLPALVRVDVSLKEKPVSVTSFNIFIVAVLQVTQ